MLMLRMFVCTFALALSITASCAPNEDEVSYMGQETPTEPDTSDDIPREGTIDMTPTVSSRILGSEQHFSVYLPPSYLAHPERQYPVLYLLHGYGQNYRSWPEGGNLKTIADGAIADGSCREMIIVCPDGHNTFYGNTYSDMRYEDFMIEELLPAVESRYRVDVSGGRAIAGLSMGGYGAAYHAFKRPQLFSSSYAMSGAFAANVGNVTTVMSLVQGMTDGQRDVLPSFTMECGTEDWLVYNSNQELHRVLESAGVEHTYITRPGQHDWAFWLVCLPKALKFASDHFFESNSSESSEAPVYQETPLVYRSTCAQAGTVETLDYVAHDADGSPRNKQCRVYLPYGYDSGKQYDVLYLMHGYGGGIRTIFEGTTNGRKLQNVADHLIADGRMRPMIVVTPTITNYQNEGNWTQFPKELREDIIPAVEGRYSSYARSTSSEDLIASRDHRAFGGFSMGSTTTWDVFEFDLAYFRTFIPISGTSWALGHMAEEGLADATAELMRQSVIEQGYTKDDFFIFAATGTNDIAYPLHSHIEAMRRLTDMFIYDHRLSAGNLYFLLAQGGQHNYDWVTDYFYVILPHLFPPIAGTSGISNNTLTTEKQVARIDYYDMQGVKIQNPKHGTPIIRRTLYTDGTIEGKKTVYRK